MKKDSAPWSLLDSLRARPVVLYRVKRLHLKSWFQKLQSGPSNETDKNL